MPVEGQRQPVSLRREGEGLRIDWSDLSSTFVSWRSLRKNCPCATCLDERQQPANPLRVLSDREVRAGAPTPVSMRPVGHYAYQISWNDGHDTGIYTLETLYRLNESLTSS